MATKRSGTTRKKDTTKKRTPSPAKVTTTSPIMAGKLQKAVKANRIDEVRALLDRGVDPSFLIQGSSVLALAVYWDHEPIVRLLLERGANPNRGTSYPSAGGAMHAAASRARVAMLPLLLQHGGDPNAAGQDDHRPLASAIEGMRPPANDWGPPQPPRSAYLSMVRVLLEAGARPELEDARGRSAWTAAIRSDDPEVFALLVSRDPGRVKGELGRRWLREAVERGSKLIDPLVALGVGVSVEALHVAVALDNARAVERLLALGADPRAKLEGKTAVELAAESGATEAAQVLARAR